MAADIPDVKDFDDIEALDKAFKKAIAKADDADETELRIAHANARASFYENASQRAALDVARRDALDKYPLAKDFADDITGTTPAEIESKTKRIHERIEAMVGANQQAKDQALAQDQATRDAARTAYGTPAAAGGNSATPAPQLTQREEIIKRVQDKLARGDGLQKSGDKMDVNVMTTERLRQAIDFQSMPHPELGIGIGGSYKGESTTDRRVRDARIDQRASRDRIPKAPNL